MKRVVVGSRKSAHKFESSEPYAVISFVGSWMGRCDTPPRIRRPPSMLARIIIRCDDCRPSRLEELDPESHPMSLRQAERVAAFIGKMAPHIDTVFIHCEQGIGRSPAAGKAICEFYGVPMENIGEYASENRRPNDYVQALVASALRNDRQERQGTRVRKISIPDV